MTDGGLHPSRMNETASIVSVPGRPLEEPMPNKPRRAVSQKRVKPKPAQVVKRRRQEMTAERMAAIGQAVLDGSTLMETAAAFDTSLSTVQDVCRRLGVKPISAAERAKRRRDAAVAEAKKLLRRR